MKTLPKVRSAGGRALQVLRHRPGLVCRIGPRDSGARGGVLVDEPDGGALPGGLGLLLVLLRLLRLVRLSTEPLLQLDRPEELLLGD